MPRPNSTWKKAELKIAPYFNGERRGADFRDKHSGGGKTDVIAPGWAIEIKHSRKPSYGLMVHAVTQARTNCDCSDDIPVGVVHRHGDEYRRSLVVMLADDFHAHFNQLTVWNARMVSGSRVSTKQVYEQLSVARAGAGLNVLPAVVVQKDNEQPLVVMYLDDFSSWFIGIKGELENGSSRTSEKRRKDGYGRECRRRRIYEENQGKHPSVTQATGNRLRHKQSEDGRSVGGQASAGA